MANIHEEEYKRVYSHLKALDADFDDLSQTENGFEVSVTWGDWKHSHIFLDNLMKNLGYHLLEEKVTESDGSDCYSSIHIYIRR